jgi:hypothetical protein
MGIIEILAGVFVISVPALVLADALDERSSRGE